VFCAVLFDMICIFGVIKNTQEHSGLTALFSETIRISWCLNVKPKPFRCNNLFLSIEMPVVPDCSRYVDSFSGVRLYALHLDKPEPVRHTRCWGASPSRGCISWLVLISSTWPAAGTESTAYCTSGPVIMKSTAASCTICSINVKGLYLSLYVSG